MTAEIISFPDKAKSKTSKYWGVCPHCGNNDGLLNIYKDHWSRCDTHKTKWLEGANLLSGWRYENEEIWQLNEYKLSQYIDVNTINLPPEGGAA